MKKNKKTRQREAKSTSKQTKLPIDEKAKSTILFLGLGFIICAFVGLFFIITTVYNQNQAHNYCVAYNAQAELTNLAMDRLSIYTDRSYPTQHEIGCPKPVFGLKWIS